MAIRFENVSYIYDTTNKYQIKDAITNINLKVENKNEFVAVIGKTGSGKSTLIQHMDGLLIPTNGVVYVDDFIIKKQRKKQNLNHIRKKVGLVFQFPEYQLFEETILKDVMFGPKNIGLTDKEALESAKKALKTVGIEENLFNKSPLNLSGGQMRKVAIAGILAMEPEILILDEPTRGLDPITQVEMLELFNNIQKKNNISIIMITHDMDVVYEYAKRVVVMKDSKIVFDGNKFDLFNNQDLHEFSLEKPEIIKIMDYIESNSNYKFNRNKIFSKNDLVKEINDNYE